MLSCGCQNGPKCLPDLLSRICSQCTLFCCDSSTLGCAWEINSELVQVCGHIPKFFLLRIFSYFRLVSSKVTEVVLAVSNVFGHLWFYWEGHWKWNEGVCAIPCLFPRKEGFLLYNSDCIMLLGPLYCYWSWRLKIISYAINKESACRKM